MICQGLWGSDTAWIWSPSICPRFSIQPCDECAGCNPVQCSRELPFYSDFLNCSARDPEVFADLILHIHTTEISSVVLCYANLQRLKNWARGLPRIVFLEHLHSPNCFVSQLPGWIGHVLCNRKKKRLNQENFGFIFSEILRHNIRQFIYKLPGLFN